MKAAQRARVSERLRTVNGLGTRFVFCFLPETRASSIGPGEHDREAARSGRRFRSRGKPGCPWPGPESSFIPGRRQPQRRPYQRRKTRRATVHCANEASSLTRAGLRASGAASPPRIVHT
ncbi:hypothetical protein MRX96_013296 [Rhipicephalus microplus]